MLLNSNSLKGKCPVCGAASCACGGPSKVVPVDQNVSTAGSGPLRKYPLGRGVFVQLTDEAARARGFLSEEKQRDSAPNKLRRSSRNKSIDRGERGR